MRLSSINWQMRQSVTLMNENLENNARVLVVGDIMLDTWKYLESYRVSPEADIPIVKIISETHALGGAGNALRHLNSLSKSRHRLISAIGKDSTGLQIKSLIKSAGSDIDLLEVDRVTTAKIRVSVDGTPIFREDVEELTELDSASEELLFRKIQEVVSEYDVILLSDYAKGLISKSLASSLLKISRDNGKITVVDPGVNRIGLYEGFDYIKPNEKEWAIYVKTIGDENEAIGKLIDSGTKGILITLGSRGVRYIDNSLNSYVIPTLSKIEVLDVTGAGDSVAAALCLRVKKSTLLMSDIDYLNQVGGKTVSKLRTEL